MKQATDKEEQELERTQMYTVIVDEHMKVHTLGDRTKLMSLFLACY